MLSILIEPVNIPEKNGKKDDKGGKYEYHIIASYCIMKFVNN